MNANVRDARIYYASPIIFARLARLTNSARGPHGEGPGGLRSLLWEGGAGCAFAGSRIARSAENFVKDAESFCGASASMADVGHGRLSPAVCRLVRRFNPAVASAAAAHPQSPLPHVLMNIPDKIKKLEALRAEVVALEQSIASEQRKELAGLPARYGFSTVPAFLAAFRAATGRRPGRKPATSAKPGAKPARRKRSVITDEMRAQVKKMVGEGKPGVQIASTLDISLPSVHNIKKALGLVRHRK